MSKKYARKFNTPEYRKRYTGIYGSWYAMKQRCGNPNHKAYKNYGGRGITYDPKWEKFENFKKDMEEGHKRGITLDRIDNNGNYCKENCRWATRKQQMNNTRNTVILEYKGQKKTLREWADEMDIPEGTFRSRYYRGMSLEGIFYNKLYRPAKL